MIDNERLCMRCMGQLPPNGDVCPHCGCNNAQVTNAVHQLECGSILAGTYLVGCALGQGGFGITYIGWDLNLDLKVAIKEYYPQGVVTRDSVTHVTVMTVASDKALAFQKGKERFVNEARILARFTGDRSIVGVRGFFHENGTAYLVMDYIEGETLKAYALRRGGKLPAQETLTLLRPLLASLSRVHAEGLLHRDISPDNIMLRADGLVTLLDFGAARQVSAEGEHSNTINVKHGFAPEEQYRTHGEQGPWTDVYALCATIYRLTTGVTPPQALDRQSGTDELVPPNELGAGFSQAEQNAILNGLTVRANNRTQDMHQLALELYGSADGVSPSNQTIRRNTTTDEQRQNTGDNAAQAQTEAEKRAEKAEHSLKRWVTICLAAGGVVVCLAIALILSFGLTRKKNDANAVVQTQTESETQDKQTAEAPVPSFETGAAGSFFPLPTPQRIKASDQEALFQKALAYLEKGDRVRAMQTYDFSQRLSGICISSAALPSSGVPILTYQDNSIRERFQASLGTHLIAVAAGGEMGLHADGTVSTWSMGNEWENVVSISAGAAHYVALKEDGTAYALDEYNNTSAPQVVETWSDLVALEAGKDGYFTLGLRADGTALLAGKAGDGNDVSGWTDLVAVSGGAFYSIGLRSDGTLLITDYYLNDEDELKGWDDIVAISAGSWHFVALRADGTVLAMGNNTHGENDVGDWTDIIAVCAGSNYTLGLRADGTVLATGTNDYNECALNGVKLW